MTDSDSVNILGFFLYNFDSFCLILFIFTPHHYHQTVHVWKENRGWRVNITRVMPLCNLAGRSSSIRSMQVAPHSIPTSGTFFHGDLVMKTFLRLFSLFRWFKKSSCQLLAEECALSTGKLSRRLAQEQCGKDKWPRPKWPQMCWRAVK